MGESTVGNALSPGKPDLSEGEHLSLTVCREEGVTFYPNHFSTPFTSSFTNYRIRNHRFLSSRKLLSKLWNVLKWKGRFSLAGYPPMKPHPDNGLNMRIHATRWLIGKFSQSSKKSKVNKIGLRPMILRPKKWAADSDSGPSITSSKV